MSNLIEIQNQIEALQKQADEIKAGEFDKTVQEILIKMKAFGITITDLETGKLGKAKRKSGAKTASPKQKKSPLKKPSVSVPAKYRGLNGEAWSGRGLTPRWLSALVAAGQPKESFAVKTEILD